MSGVDSFHSWVVASAGFLIFLLASCPARLAAQLFVSMLDSYDTTRKEASFPFALATIVRCITGPFAGVLGEIFSLQGVSIVGCLLCAFGVGGCFFAEDVLTINICFGLMYGIGYSWSNVLVPEILNHHFKKHRNKAYGLYFSGGGLGAFLAPPLLDLILKEFGLSGTFLLMGGILLNSIPAALLLTGTKREKKSGHQLVMSTNSSNKVTNELIKFDKEESKIANKSFNTMNKESNQISTNDLDVVPILSDARLQSNVDVGYINCLYENKPQDVSKIPNLKLEVESKSHTINKIHEIQLQNSTMKLCLENIITDLKTFDKVTNVNKETREITVSLNEQDADIKTNFNSHSSQNVSASEFQLQNGKMKRITENSIDVLEKNEVPENAKISLFYKVSILWSPVFLTITLALAVAGYINLILWTITVDFVRDKGVEQYLEVYFVMCLSLFDTLGRLLLGSITDMGLMTTTNFSIFCYASSGLILISLVWLPEFYSLMVAFSLMGLSFGGITIAMPGLITTFVEKEKRSIAIASRLMLIAPLSFTISPAIGFFRGSLGSYDGLLYTMASMCFVSVIILLLLPVIAKQRDRTQMNKAKT